MRWILVTAMVVCCVSAQAETPFFDDFGITLKTETPDPSIVMKIIDTDVDANDNGIQIKIKYTIRNGSPVNIGGDGARLLVFLDFYDKDGFVLEDQIAETGPRIARGQTYKKQSTVTILDYADLITETKKVVLRLGEFR